MTTPLLDVCIPLGKGRIVHPEALRFTKEIECRVMVDHDTADYKSEGWLQRLCERRTKLLEQVTAPYWLALDADTVIDAGCITKAYDWLTEHADWGGVGFSLDGRANTVNHVRMCASMLRTEATSGMTFKTTYNNYRRCECSVFTCELHDRGWKYDYLPELTCRHYGGDAL